MAVVKANAYGHGAVPVARAAAAAGASHLAVYTVDEGVQLRASGITAPILVFGPVGHLEARGVVAHDLTATITRASTAEQLAGAAGGRPVRVHLKVDTGLTRAGVGVDDALPLLNRLRDMSAIEVEGIYTHLARADEPGEPATGEQLSVFGALLQTLSAGGHSFNLVHAANSGGALWHADAWFDLVRLGIAMYGYNPGAPGSAPIALRPALSLLSQVSRVTQIERGTGVGYGHAFRPDRPTRIALVPIGYGDGIHRALGNGVGSVLIRGAKVPVVGRVSMDQITLDVTDVPSVSVGDAVTLIGRQGDTLQTADDLAHATGTISYEIVTSLQPRVPRLYSRAGSLVSTLALSSYHASPAPPLPDPARE